MPNASQIKERMEVKGSDGKHVGTVLGVDREECKVLRAVWRQEFSAALLVDVRSQLGQALSVVYVVDGWV